MSLADEFTCAECDAIVFAFGRQDSAPPLCATCVTSPGWFRYPELRACIAPEMTDADVAAIDAREIGTWNPLSN